MDFMAMLVMENIVYTTLQDAVKRKNYCKE